MLNEESKVLEGHLVKVEGKVRCLLQASLQLNVEQGTLQATERRRMQTAGGRRLLADLTPLIPMASWPQKRPSKFHGWLKTCIILFLASPVRLTRLIFLASQLHKPVRRANVESMQIRDIERLGQGFSS
jgi:hypothetical protein